MADKTWKRIEREKCKELGGERSGPTGRDTPDCDERVHVALEVKSYKRFVFLSKDWQQAVDNAAKVGKIPVLAVKERGRNGRDEVQLKLCDLEFLTLAGRGDASAAGLLELPLKLAVNPLIPIGGRPLVRLPWDVFVRLYGAAFNTDKEQLLGSR